MSDDGLTEATQRVMAEICAVRDLTDTLHKCLTHVSVWGVGELGCATAEKAARAAREDVADRIQQARADAWDEAADLAKAEREASLLGLASRVDHDGLIANWLGGIRYAETVIRSRAAAIREAGR